MMISFSFHCTSPFTFYCFRIFWSLNYTIQVLNHSQCLILKQHKMLLTLLLSLMAWSTKGQFGFRNPNFFKCPSPGLFPVAKGCTQYHRCLFGGMPPIATLPCGKGQIFVPDLQKCVVGDLISCRVLQTQTGRSTGCEKDGFEQDPVSREYFIQCTNGIATRMRCYPPGSIFYGATEQCASPNKEQTFVAPTNHRINNQIFSQNIGLPKENPWAFNSSFPTAFIYNANFPRLNENSELEGLGKLNSEVVPDNFWTSFGANQNPQLGMDESEGNDPTQMATDYSEQSKSNVYEDNSGNQDDTPTIYSRVEISSGKDMVNEGIEFGETKVSGGMSEIDTVNYGPEQVDMEDIGKPVGMIEDKEGMSQGEEEKLEPDNFNVDYPEVSDYQQVYEEKDGQQTYDELPLNIIEKMGIENVSEQNSKAVFIEENFIITERSVEIPGMGTSSERDDTEPSMEFNESTKSLTSYDPIVTQATDSLEPRREAETFATSTTEAVSSYVSLSAPDPSSEIGEKPVDNNPKQILEISNPTSDSSDETANQKYDSTLKSATEATIDFKQNSTYKDFASEAYEKVDQNDRILLVTTNTSGSVDPARQNHDSSTLELSNTEAATTALENDSIAGGSENVNSIPTEVPLIIISTSDSFYHTETNDLTYQQLSKEATYTDSADGPAPDTDSEIKYSNKVEQIGAEKFSISNPSIPESFDSSLTSSSTSDFTLSSAESATNIKELSASDTKLITEKEYMTGENATEEALLTNFSIPKSIDDAISAYSSSSWKASETLTTTIPVVDASEIALKTEDQLKIDRNSMEEIPLTGSSTFDSFDSTPTSTSHSDSELSGTKSTTIPNDFSASDMDSRNEQEYLVLVNPTEVFLVTNSPSPGPLDDIKTTLATTNMKSLSAETTTISHEEVSGSNTASITEDQTKVDESNSFQVPSTSFLMYESLGSYPPAQSDSNLSLSSTEEDMITKDLTVSNANSITENSTEKVLVTSSSSSKSLHEATTLFSSSTLMPYDTETPTIPIEDTSESIAALTTENQLKIDENSLEEIPATGSSTFDSFESSPTSASHSDSEFSGTKITTIPNDISASDMDSTNEDEDLVSETTTEEFLDTNSPSSGSLDVKTTFATTTMKSLSTETTTISHEDVSGSNKPSVTEDQTEEDENTTEEVPRTSFLMYESLESYPPAQSDSNLSLSSPEEDMITKDLTVSNANSITENSTEKVLVTSSSSSKSLHRVTTLFLSSTLTPDDKKTTANPVKDESGSAIDFMTEDKMKTEENTAEVTATRLVASDSLENTSTPQLNLHSVLSSTETSTISVDAMSTYGNEFITEQEDRDRETATEDVLVTSSSKSESSDDVSTTFSNSTLTPSEATTIRIASNDIVASDTVSMTDDQTKLDENVTKKSIATVSSPSDTFGSASTPPSNSYLTLSSTEASKFFNGTYSSDVESKAKHEGIVRENTTEESLVTSTSTSKLLNSGTTVPTSTVKQLGVETTTISIEKTPSASTISVGTGNVTDQESHSSSTPMGDIASTEGAASSGIESPQGAKPITNTPAQVGTISGRMMSSGGFSKLDDEVIEDNSEVTTPCSSSYSTGTNPTVAKNQTAKKGPKHISPAKTDEGGNKSGMGR